MHCGMVKGLAFHFGSLHETSARRAGVLVDNGFRAGLVSVLLESWKGWMYGSCCGACQIEW